MTDLVTATRHDDLTVEQRRTLARFEAAVPAPESFDATAALRRVGAFADTIPTDSAELRWVIEGLYRALGEYDYDGGQS